VTSRGERFLAELSTWEGTPFHPQQATKGKGCDCKGAMWGAAKELGFPEADSFYATFVNYDLTKAHGVPVALLKEGMAALFDRVEEMEPGDLLLCRVHGAPGHLAAYAGNGEALHTQIKSKAYLKRTNLRALLKVYPLDSVWRWRDDP
jgi:cell wall-associated NlpC family hydrolase